MFQLYSERIRNLYHTLRVTVERGRKNKPHLTIDLSATSIRCDAAPLWECAKVEVWSSVLHIVDEHSGQHFMAGIVGRGII